jgi:hypothetical protein
MVVDDEPGLRRVACVALEGDTGSIGRGLA